VGRAWRWLVPSSIWCEVLAFSFALDASDGDFMNDSRAAHINLQIIARQIMLEHGFEPDFPATVQKQLADIKSRPPLASPSSTDVRDLRNLLWSSIDNDTSRALDHEVRVYEPGWIN
jgi:hypothetical protein